MAADASNRPVGRVVGVLAIGVVATGLVAIGVVAGTVALSGPLGAGPTAGRSLHSGMARPVARPVAEPATAPRLDGTFTVWAATPRADPCQSRPEAADLHAGAPVVLLDPAGTTIATTTLDTGRPDATHRGCAYPFTVSGPPAANSYTVRVGDHLGPTVDRSTLRGSGWHLALNLGLPDPPGKP
jgi:hypothetical protein